MEDMELLMADIVRVMPLPLPRMDGRRRVDGIQSMIDGDIEDQFL